MITLPAGFDYSLLIADFFYSIIPFVGIAVLLASFRIINRILGGGR